MEDWRPSVTALGVAARRAAHQIFDRPLILDDPVALQILPPERAAALTASPDKSQTALSRGLRAFMVARSRHTEDQLATAIGQGVRHYVILGAGLDTFAYRNPFPHLGLRIFEVDHPATQAWKRERLAAAGISVPSELTFVPVDFERQSLFEQLHANGLSADQPVFFSWLGVTPYLTREAFAGTVAFIAAQASPSGVTFDYAVRRDLLPARERAALDFISSRVAEAGEPFQLFFNAQDLAQELHQNGFQQIEDLGAAELNARYFSNRSDGFQIQGSAGRLVTAWTGTKIAHLHSLREPEGIQF